MKNIIYVGIIFLLLALTACPSKDKTVEPKVIELIGKWEWVLSSCDCPQCKCIFNYNPQKLKRMHYLDVKKDSVTYFSKDTLLFTFKYEKNIDNSIKIRFENFADSQKKEKYNYLLLDGIISLSKDTIKIKNDLLFMELKKIVK